MPRRTLLSFGVRSGVVWLVMVVVLVVVPDALEASLSLPVARVVGWVLASGIWMAVVERDWQERFRPVARFVLTVMIWLSAALVALWVSSQFRVNF